MNKQIYDPRRRSYFDPVPEEIETLKGSQITPRTVNHPQVFYKHLKFTFSSFPMSRLFVLVKKFTNLLGYNNLGRSKFVYLRSTPLVQRTDCHIKVVRDTVSLERTII